MSLVRKRVIIVDDEKDIRDSLTMCFEGSTKYAFDVVAKASPEECIELDLETCGDFDICIIDLGFHSRFGEDGLTGNRLLAGLGCLRSSGLGIVYTGQSSLRNAARAMRLGAADVVSKSEMDTSELVEHVEELLADRADQAARRERVADYIEDHHDQYRQEYAGKTLAIVATGEGVDLAAMGRSRLETLLNYSKARQQKDWPTDPYLYSIPDDHPG
jgi:DNA-binding NarL/FixJ family response regulator